MSLDALAVKGDQNLAAAWAALGRHGGYALGSADTVTLTASGLPIAFFNGAFAAGPCRDPASAVADVVEFFGSRAVPFLLWVRDGVDEALLAAGRAAGLRDAGGPPAMVLASIGSIPEPPGALEVRIAVSADELQAHRDVIAAGFGMPAEVTAQILGDGILGDPDLAVAVGYHEGRAVTTALLARSSDTAGVYNVATVPDARGKGFGAAATWAVVAEGARRGCSHSVLQSSPDGYPVYRRMGFVDVGPYVQLEGPPA